MYKDLVKHTYDKIFEDGLHFLSKDMDELKNLILKNRELITNKAEKALFIYELANKIKTDKIAEAIRQENQYGFVLMNDYEDIKLIYDWLNGYEEDKIGKPKFVAYTYKWNTKWDEKSLKINDLYKLSKQYGLIGKETKYKDFVFVFKSNPLNEIQNPIRWASSNATQLLYYILQLMERGLIEKQNRMKYELLIACFVKNEGEAFSESFKSLKTDIAFEISQDYKDIIEKIISKIKP